MTQNETVRTPTDKARVAGWNNKVTEKLKTRIDALTQEEMARKWRYAPIGDPMFQGEAGQYFERRFKKLGGFTPEISKRIDK